MTNDYNKRIKIIKEEVLHFIWSTHHVPSETSEQLLILSQTSGWYCNGMVMLCHKLSSLLWYCICITSVYYQDSFSLILENCNSLYASISAQWPTTAPMMEPATTSIKWCLWSRRRDTAQNRDSVSIIIWIRVRLYDDVNLRWR